MVSPLPEPPPDPTTLFRVMAGDVADIFRNLSDRLEMQDAADLRVAADAIDRALAHLRPGALTGGYG